MSKQRQAIGTITQSFQNISYGPNGQTIVGPPTQGNTTTLTAFTPYGNNLEAQKFKTDTEGRTDWINLEDTRKIDATSGQPITDTNKLSTLADPNLVKRIIQGAKDRKIDPYTALSIAAQETGLGKMEDWKNNPMHLNPPRDQYGKPTAPYPPDMDMVDKGLDFLKEKMDYAKRLKKNNSDEELIQSWNGYGKIPYEVGKESMYGIDLSTLPNQTLDMNKNPVYGKRIVDLRDNVVKTNPAIQSMVKDIYGGEPIHATSEHIKEAKAHLGYVSDDDFSKYMLDKKGISIIPID